MSFSTLASHASLALIDTVIKIELPQPDFDAFGNIIQSGFSIVKTGIDSTMFDLFTHEFLYVKTEVYLDSTNVGENTDGWVFIDPAKDFINIKTYLELNLHLNPEHLND